MFEWRTMKKATTTKKQTAATPKVTKAKTKKPKTKEALRPDLATLLKGADDLKSVNNVAIDLRGITSFADFFFVTSGTSDRHVRSIADSIVKTMKKAGYMPIGVEGLDQGRWVLIDFGDIVAHVFQEDDRGYYQIEEFWSQAPKVPLA